MNACLPQSPTGLFIIQLPYPIYKKGVARFYVQLLLELENNEKFFYLQKRNPVVDFLEKMNLTARVAIWVSGTRFSGNKVISPLKQSKAVKAVCININPEVCINRFFSLPRKRDLFPVKKDYSRYSKAISHPKQCNSVRYTMLKLEIFVIS